MGCRIVAAHARRRVLVGHSAAHPLCTMRNSSISRKAIQLKLWRCSSAHQAYVFSCACSYVSVRSVRNVEENMPARPSSSAAPPSLLLSVRKMWSTPSHL